MLHVLVPDLDAGADTPRRVEIELHHARHGRRSRRLRRLGAATLLAVGVPLSCVVVGGLAGSGGDGPTTHPDATGQALAATGREPRFGVRPQDMAETLATFAGDLRVTVGSSRARASASGVVQVGEVLVDDGGGPALVRVVVRRPAGACSAVPVPCAEGFPGVLRAAAGVPHDRVVVGAGAGFSVTVEAYGATRPGGPASRADVPLSAHELEAIATDDVWVH